jgi:hypothetical protein
MKHQRGRQSSNPATDDDRFHNRQAKHALRQWVKSSHQGGFSATVWQAALSCGGPEKALNLNILCL